ncbi:MAG TPA: sulfurtransferase [Dehalococcoidia bacterium]|nr:sulfurtransferase [Dehalococcoidia bacterium]
MTDYARADILVDGDWLQRRLQDPLVRVVDCDGTEAWARAHIEGAVSIPDNHLKDPNNRLFTLDPEQFADLMGRLGIGDDTTVVAYDTSGARYSGRLWWCLRYYGHERARILNGGWPKWFREGRPVSIDKPQPPAAKFTPRPNRYLFASAEDVKAAIGKPGTVILDVRSDGEWEGTETRGNRRTGRIPGSVHVEWLNNVTADELQLMKPADVLRRMYEEAGVTPDQEVITVCQAGVRAAQAATVLTLLGFDRVRVYDGSFAEWGNRDDTPIER